MEGISESHSGSCVPAVGTLKSLVLSLQAQPGLFFHISGMSFGNPQVWGVEQGSEKWNKPADLAKQKAAAPAPQRTPTHRPPQILKKPKKQSMMQLNMLHIMIFLP